MKTMLTIICLVTLVAFESTAQEPSNVSSVQQINVTPEKSIDNQKNYFGVRLLTLSGMNLSYARRLGTRFLLGTSFSFGSFQEGDKKHGGGDLNSGQYYAQQGQVDMSGQEINMTFFFREDGFKKWGPSMRLAVGRLEGTIQGKFYRYDRDPGFFNFDDDKRLRETGPNVKDHFVTPYAKLGGYYQFVWTPNAAIGGHILELGASAAFLRDRPQINVVRSDGSVKKIAIDEPIPLAEVAYMFTF